jgi:hypothetical protein
MKIHAFALAIFTATLFGTAAQADNNIPTRPPTTSPQPTNTTQIEQGGTSTPGGGRPTVTGHPSGPFNPVQVTFPDRPRPAGQAVVRPRPVVPMQTTVTGRPRVMQARIVGVARPQTMQMQPRPMSIAARPMMPGRRR